LTQICTVAIIVAVIHRKKIPVAPYLGLTIPSCRHIAYGVAAAAFFIVIITARLWPIHFHIGLIRWEPEFLVLFVANVIVAPLCEELLFRGFIYRGLAPTRLGVAGAILITAILFAVSHPAPLPKIIDGIVLGGLRWWTRSTTTPLMAHATNNLFVWMLAALGRNGWLS
jgi:CAAX protease family protein